jgi:undecaprenyl-diphosphatase
MQSTALVPGISRSASTISCARILGWNAQEAVRFSFLLAIPTMLGGNCLTLLKISGQITNLPISLSSYLIGFIASCLTGLAVIGPAIRCLENGKLQPFAWYCLVLGITLCMCTFAGIH